MGILIGIVFGALQLYLLLLGVKGLGAARLKIWPFLFQFLCPMAGLLLCAFLARGQLLLCACIIVAILVAGALFVWLRRRKQEKNNREEKV